MPVPGFTISKNLYPWTLNATYMHQTAPGLLSIANYTQFDDTLPVAIHPHGAMRPHFAYHPRSCWDAAVQVCRYGYESAL